MKKSLYLIGMILIAAILLFLPVIEHADDSGGTPVNKEAEAEADPWITFPYVLEEGRLEITSLFQSSIPNPDKGFEEGADLASVELVNKSGEYLKKADITLTLEDGTKLIFQVSDIPAGKTVWAFDMANTTMEAEMKCLEIQCEAEFDKAYDGWEGQFHVNAEAATAEVTNLTDQEQTDIKVIFHCVMEGVYFGGTSYEYSIDKLAPQESAVLEVIECYFGDSEAVQITY